MVKDQQIQQPLLPTSQLENFTLDFEYDKTIRQVKRDVRLRAESKALK